MKKIRVRFLILLLIVMCSSCGSKKKTADDGYYFQDFDNLNMWSRGTLLTKERAHSGTYAAFTDSIHEYSQTFEMDLSHVRSLAYRYVLVSGWCFRLNENTKAGFVISIENPEKSWVYVSEDFALFLKTPQTWGKVTKSVRIPDDAPANSKIKIYVWAPKKEKTFLDDVEIQFTK